MLVLSRKPNESIVINEIVVVTVLRIQGERVRFGIEAPLNVPVRRSELNATIEKRAASMSAG
jgi:carbon storage regulator